MHPPRLLLLLLAATWVVVALLYHPYSLTHAAVSPDHVVIVVPCYNEATRLPVQQYVDYASSPFAKDMRLKFLFVNDGSKDDTLGTIAKLTMIDPKTFHLLNMETNVGKAEAVRFGFLHAFEKFPEAAYVGFWDSDLATPLDAINDFMKVFHEFPERIEMVFGARVALLGRDIHRLPERHYLGRVFATLASLLLDLRIYDTQCGSKIFKVTDELRHSLEGRPFGSRWIFDVEWIARLSLERRRRRLRDPNMLPIDRIIYEYPLREWRDVEGSKISFTDKVRALEGLFSIWKKYYSPWV